VCHDVTYWRFQGECGPVLRLLARAPGDGLFEADLVSDLQTGVKIVYDSCMQLVEANYLKLDHRPVEGMDRAQRCYRVTSKGIELAGLLDT